jgi:ribonuclease R
MLPRTLCEDLVSLNPLVDRRAMVLRMKIGAEGRCLGTEFLRARVRSRAKLSYQGVQAWLDGGQAPSQDPEVQTSLRELVTVGERRLHEAESRDVVRFRRQEVSVSVGGKGLSFVARVSPRNDVERYNEQISLLANIQAARWLRDAHGDPRVQPIFRTHEPPLDAALEAFSQQLEGLVQAHALDPSRWSWSPGGCESLAAFVRRLPLEEGPHQGVARAISREALRTGGRSGFSSTPSGHHGVGAEVYSRFTAPMREVVGIFVHKELWEHLEKQEANPSQEDERIREQIVSVSQAARRRQRALDQECNRLVLDQLFTSDMQQQPVPPRVATVMGVGRGKIHLQLQDPPIEIKAYRRDLERILGEQLHLEMGGAQVCGSDGTLLFRVGDPVRVQVRGLDPELDRWSLDVESVFEKE